MDNIQPRDFWEKPEGKTGLFFAAILIFGGAMFVFSMLPYIILMLTNIITAIILLGIIGSIIYVVSDPKFRLIASTFYKLLMKKLTGIVINIDPIAIIEDQINYLEKNRSKMNDEMGKLKGQQRNLDTVINTNKNNVEKHIATANQAKKQNIAAQVTLETRQASRLKESNDRLIALRDKIVMIYKILQKMYENSGFLLEDTKSEVETRKQEYIAMKTAYSAVRSAMKVINGDPDRVAMFEQAMDVIAQDISMKVGEMERFMEVSATFMQSIDLQNGVFEDKGMKMLEEWEKSSTFLLGDDKQFLLDSQSIPTVSKRTDYSVLFNKN